MIYETNAGNYELHTILLDLNGTLTVGGVLDERVPIQLETLKSMGYRIVLLTGDQRGSAAFFSHLPIEIVIASNTEAKKQFALANQPEYCVAIGNARIDIGMFEVCKLRIATLQSEGIHSAILSHTDIIVPSIVDALNCLIEKNIFAATMKI